MRTLLRPQLVYIRVQVFVRGRVGMNTRVSGVALQVAYQALGKVEPVTHAVGNVGKRIFVIGFSILAFGAHPLSVSGCSFVHVQSLCSIPDHIDMTNRVARRAL